MTADIPSMTIKPQTLPCPFCGGNPQVKVSDWSKSTISPFIAWWVECPRCGSRGNWEATTRSEAIQRWNQRAEGHEDRPDQPAVAAVIAENERLRAINSAIAAVCKQALAEVNFNETIDFGTRKAMYDVVARWEEG